MAKRYFEIEMSENEYDDLLRIAGEQGITPSDVLKSYWDERNNTANKTKFHGTPINELTKYLIKKGENYPVAELQRFLAETELITNSYKRLGELYYEKLSDIENKYFEEDIRDEKGCLSDILKERQKIWNAIGISADGCRKYEEERLMMQFAEQFLNNIIEEDDE